MKKLFLTSLVCLGSLAVMAQSKITMSVDMGTSVKWANSTMDGLFRYGEVTPCTNATESTYVFYSSLADNLSWTYTNSYGATTTQTYRGGFTDLPLDIAGSPAYDPATTLGEGWRLPTASEMQEMVQACTFRLSADGRYWVVNSNSTGNIIVLEHKGYLTYIGEYKDASMHIMVGESATTDPRKYVSNLVLSKSDGGARPSVSKYVSLDKVTNALPVWPVYDPTPRTPLDIPYNPETGDIYPYNEMPTAVRSLQSEANEVRYYVSESGVVTTACPTQTGTYVVVYKNGTNAKVFVK